MILATFGSVLESFLLWDVLSYFDGLCIRSEMEGAAQISKFARSGDRRAANGHTPAK